MTHTSKTDQQWAGAEKQIDWKQVVLNGGPPCFFVLDGKFCLRAERWAGHCTLNGKTLDHTFVSLADLLAEVREAERDKLLCDACRAFGIKVNFHGLKPLRCMWY